MQCGTPVHSSPCWGTLRWEAHLTQLRKRWGKPSVPPAGGFALWLVLPAHAACSSFFHVSSPIFIDANFSPHWGWEGWPPSPPSSASLGSWVQSGAPRPADARVLSLPGTQIFGSGTTLTPRKDERHRLAPGGRCCRTACEQPPRSAPLFAVPTPPPPSWEHLQLSAWGKGKIEWRSVCLGDQYRQAIVASTAVARHSDLRRFDVGKEWQRRL